MSLPERIALVKQVDLLDALDRLCPALEHPARIPGHVLCPFPDHPEESPSFYLQHHRWHCFGCGRGGDAIDFAQALLGVELLEALVHVEVALDLVAEEEGCELERLVAMARSPARRSEAPTLRSWAQEVAAVESEFLRRVRPFLRCLDPTVAALGRGRADLVFAGLDDAARKVPRTVRRAREELRALRRWTAGWAAGVELDVLRVTGKDRLDAALQCPPFEPLDPREAVVARAFLRALASR